MYDVAIIGGGVLGNMTARELSRYRLDRVVLEKEYDVGESTSKANSGIIHAGFHPREGSLKGLSCVEGNDMFPRLCEELDVPFKRIGSLFIAFKGEESGKRLERAWARGQANGVKGMRLLTAREVLEREPGLNPAVGRAIYAPSTGIISPFKLVGALAESAILNGVRYSFNSEVVSVTDQGGHYALRTKASEAITARFIVNTAGGFANHIEGLVRPADLVIKPRRGQYYVFDKGEYVKHVVYQSQETGEGGTLVTPTIEGNLLVGPTSENVKGFDRTETTREGLEHVERVARKILPGLDLSKVIANFAGIRANIANVAKEEKDFVVRVSAPGFVSALGIKNPGMTSAPALSRMIAGMLRNEGLRLEVNKAFIPERKAIGQFLGLTPDKQESALADNPANGKIICRCEGISEGDILRALHRPIKTTSLDGLKKRLGLGMGQCQGAFCVMRAIERLSSELGLPPQKILKNTPGSYYVAGDVK
jgi:glycerol-3-phosphate dehydrogenase